MATNMKARASDMSSVQTWMASEQTENGGDLDKIRGNLDAIRARLENAAAKLAYLYGEAEQGKALSPSPGGRIPGIEREIENISSVVSSIESVVERL